MVTTRALESSPRSRPLSAISSSSSLEQRLDEAGEGVLHGEHRRHHPEAVSKAADDLQREGAVGDGFVNVGEGVSKGLEAATVLADGEVALSHGTELGQMWMVRPGWLSWKKVSSVVHT